MKTSLVLICLVMTLTSQCLAGTLIVDPLTVPVLIVHEKGVGSGCFLQLSNSVYLVTAKHVLFSEPEGTNPPALLSSKAIVKAYSGIGTTNVSERIISLDLGVLMNAGEIRFSKDRDIALVRVEECNPNDKNFVISLPGMKYTSSAQGLTLYSGLCVLSNVDVGADVYMFGYPISLTAPIRDKFDPAQPLLRKGIVAGVNLAKR